MATEKPAPGTPRRRRTTRLSAAQKAKARQAIQTAVPAKVGRPSKYTPEYGRRAIELGKHGLTSIEIWAELGISPTTFFRWQHEHPEFRESLHEARMHAQAWWEKAGRAAIFGLPALGEGDSRRPFDTFNASAYKFAMESRFPEDYRRRLELTGADGGPIEHRHSVDEIDRLLEVLSDDALGILEGIAVEVSPPDDTGTGGPTSAAA